MRGMNLFALKDCIQDMERHFNSTSEEPRKYMLFIKQHLQPPETLKATTPVLVRQSALGAEQVRPKTQTMVEH